MDSWYGSFLDGRGHRIVCSYVCALATTVLLGSAPALAGPPLITDDPDTPGRNRWEINLSYSLEVTREPIEVEPPRVAGFASDVFNGVVESLGLSDWFSLSEPGPRTIHRKSLEHELPLVDINYGVTDRDQLKIEFPVLTSDPADGSTRRGMGNLLVGYKYRILDESDSTFSLSLYPQLELPTGARKLGLDRKPAYILPVEIGRHFLDDKLFVYGEVGFVAAPGKGF